MITGEVNTDLEASISILVCGSDGAEQQISAVIDTGFTGFLTLPAALVSNLNLEWVIVENAMLGDGHIYSFDVYRAIVIWDGSRREVEVTVTETAPLIGMAMLLGHALQIEAVIGGRVHIEPLPSV